MIDMGDFESIDGRRGLVAALEEMRVWVIIMAEHAKFIRMGLDPSPAQEAIFRTADRFAVNFERLYTEVSRTPKEAPPQVLYNLRERTILMTNQLIAFKRTIFAALESCQALAILPAGLVDHIRREADRFVGTLERSKGRLTKTRQDLGIPDGQKMAQTLPRLFYRQVSAETLFTAAVEENLFFIHISAEHAGHLAMTFRPEVQERYRNRALAFERDLTARIEVTKQVEEAGQGLRAVLQENTRILVNFRNYLNRLLEDLLTCTIPTGQANFPPLLVDHMRRETNYIIDINERILALIGA